MDLWRILSPCKKNSERMHILLSPRRGNTHACTCSCWTLDARIVWQLKDIDIWISFCQNKRTSPLCWFHILCHSFEILARSIIQAIVFPKFMDLNLNQRSLRALFVGELDKLVNYNIKRYFDRSFSWIKPIIKTLRFKTRKYALFSSVD